MSLAAVQTAPPKQATAKEVTGVNLNYLIPGLAAPCTVFVYEKEKFVCAINEGELLSMPLFYSFKKDYNGSGFILQVDVAKWEASKSARHPQYSKPGNVKKEPVVLKGINHPLRDASIQTFTTHCFGQIGWIQPATPEELAAEKQAIADLRSICQGETLAWFFGEARPDDAVFLHNARVAYLSALFAARYLSMIPKDLLNVLLSGAVIHELVGDPTKSTPMARSEPTLKLIESKGYFLTDTIKNLIEQHEEKFNGTGLPRKLKGAEISILARIMALADQWDHFWIGNPGGTRRVRKDRAKAEFAKRAAEFDPKLYKLFMEFIERIEVLF